MTSKALEGFARFVIRHRILAICGVFLVVAMAGYQTKNLSADFTPQDLFTTYEDEQRVAEDFKEVFGNTENVLLLLVQAENVLAPDVVEYVHQLSTHLEQAEFADRVESITLTSFVRASQPGVLDVSPIISGNTVEPEEVRALEDAIEASALVEGTLISKSRRLTAVAVFLTTDVIRVEAVGEAIDEVDAYLATVDLPSGATVMKAGLPHIRVDVTDRFVEDQTRLVPMAMFFSFLVMLVAFRWLPGVVFPGIAVLGSALLIVGSMALVGEPLNIINQIVPILVIIIGMSDAIHLVSRFREEKIAGGGSPEAAQRTLRHMAIACFLTSFTTAVGFASLAVSKTDILKRFGITAAVGVVFAYGVTVFLLPPLLSWTKPKLRPGEKDENGELVDRTIVRIVKRVLAHPKQVTLWSSLLLLAGVVLASQVTIDSRLLETFEEDDPVWTTTVLAQQELDGVLPIELSFTSDVEGRFDDPDVVNAMRDLDAWIATLPGVLSTTSYPDFLGEVRVAYQGDESVRDAPLTSIQQVAQLASLLEGARPNPLAPYVTLDRRRARLNIQVSDIGANATIVLGNQITSRIEELFGSYDDVHVDITGDAWVGSAGLRSLIRDMIVSLSTAFIIIFFFIALLFRSVRLGLLSIPPNVIPLVLTMAFMTVVGIELNTTTVVIFSVSLGLAVDDTIHMLARFSEGIRAGASRDEAIMMACLGAGKAILVTSLVLGGGMLILLMSSFIPIQLFGTLIGVTVLSCVVGDLLLLPALLKLGWPEVKGAAPNL